MPRSIHRLLVILVSLPGSLALAEQPGPKTISTPNFFQVWYHTGGPLKFVLQDDNVHLISPQGDKLRIPAAEVLRIDFALSNRLSSDVRKQIEAAVKGLESEQFSDRKTATAVLHRLGRQACPALLKAAASKDVEVAHRAKILLRELHDETFDEEVLSDLLKYDVVQTAQKKIVGRIDMSVFRAQAASADELQLNLAELRRVQSLAMDVNSLLDGRADPGNLIGFRDHIGETFVFKITGVLGEPVWGTKVYTDDSSLATAAVHAGVVKPNQTKKLYVKILAPLQSYQGSQQNGVLSGAWGPFQGSFQFAKPTRR